MLGISSDAVRKRAKRGTMPSETGADGRLYVRVDAGESDTYPPASLADRGELVDELRDRVQSLEGQLAAEREASGELRQIIAAMTSRIPEIEPPREAELPPEPPDAPENAAAPGEANRYRRPTDGYRGA